MENVLLTVHLILALLLIGVVLLQRSEGGGLGMSGGGSGVMSSRGAANALTKLTWIFAIGFIITSVSLTVLAAQQSNGISVVDQLGGSAPASQSGTTPAAPAIELAPPSSRSADEPATPPALDAPATPPASQ